MKKKHILKECWVWNEKLNKLILKLFKKYRVSENIINVCAGKSIIGDIKIDLDPKDKSVLKGDMRLIPFKSNIFNGCVEDPPWKIGYYERMKPFFECVRVTKVDGIIIYNATWIPESTDVKLLEMWVRQDNSFSNTSIISVFRKTKENPVYESKQESQIKKFFKNLKMGRKNE